MSKIGLVMGREFNIRVRKKSFILTTLLMPLLMVAMVGVPMLISIYGGDNKAKEIVVIDKSGVIYSELKEQENITFALSKSNYPEVVEEYTNAFGFLVIDSSIVANPKLATLYTNQTSTLSVENNIRGQLSSIVTNIRIKDSGVENLAEIISKVEAKAQIATFKIERNEKGEVSEKVSSSGIAASVSYISSFMIYMFILIYGIMVLNGVVEEKSNRVMEIMVSSVRPFQLMMGKILGVASVAVLQFMIWVVLGAGGMVAVSALGIDLSAAAEMGTGGIGMEAVQSSLPPQLITMLSVITDPAFIVRVLGSFILYFVGGYLLYASMFAAIGSAVDNVADTQQLQIPVTIPLIISIFIMISVMQNPNSPLAFWCSMIPFTSPIIMMARISYGVPWWEFALSIAILYGSFVGMTYLAAKIYRVGIFMYGKKPTLREVLRWARYKS